MFALNYQANKTLFTASKSLKASSSSDPAHYCYLSFQRLSCVPSSHMHSAMTEVFSYWIVFKSSWSCLKDAWVYGFSWCKDWCLNIRSVGAFKDKAELSESQRGRRSFCSLTAADIILVADLIRGELSFRAVCQERYRQWNSTLRQWRLVYTNKRSQL